MTDEVESAEANVVYAVFAVHHCGNGHRCIYSRKQAFAYVANGNRYRIEGCALARDDSATRLSYVLFDFVKIESGAFHARKGNQFIAF